MKKLILLLFLALAIGAAIWGKNYYNDRYVLDEYVYTQIPPDANATKDEWLYDDNGKKTQKGKEYQLKGYNKEGKERDVQFSIPGTAKNYYKPDTIIKVSMSKTIVIGQQIVTETDVPKKALQQINK